jgi:hypothetical protein
MYCDSLLSVQQYIWEYTKSVMDIDPFSIPNVRYLKC